MSVHPDLRVTTADHGDVTTTLIGFAVDPLRPEASQEEIVRGLATGSLRATLQDTSSLCGRWVILADRPSGRYLFTDSRGYRQLFYTRVDGEKWCSSQPALLNEVQSMAYRDDEAMYRLLSSKAFAENNSMNVGDKTPYENCRHLLPNHLLDFGDWSVKRFFPPNKSELTNWVQTDSGVVEAVMGHLSGTIEAMNERAELDFAVTSGADSRVLLAASKACSEQIHYYVDRMGKKSPRHPDITVPKQIAHDFGLSFTVRNSDVDLSGYLTQVVC